MNKAIFEIPSLDVIKFNVNDFIITASPTNPGIELPPDQGDGWG